MIKFQCALVISYINWLTKTRFASFKFMLFLMIIASQRVSGGVILVEQWGTLIYLKEFGLYSSIFYLILYIFYSFEVVLLMKILFFPFFLYYIESLWQQIENSLGANSKYGWNLKVISWKKLDSGIAAAYTGPYVSLLRLKVMNYIPESHLIHVV